MAKPKTVANRILTSLPDDVSWEEIIDRLTVRSQIQKGLDDAHAGRVVPHEHVMAEMDEWLVSTGPSKPAKISA